MKDETTAPPEYCIELARQRALESPCAKTQRGAILFHRTTLDWAIRTKNDVASLANGPLDVVVSSGYNGPPYPFACTASAECRKACGMICMHAEQRALLAALERAGSRSANRSYVYRDEFKDMEMVHVKVIDRQVVPGGPPSCLQCSRLLVETGIRGIWLFEIGDIGAPFEVMGAWRFYDSVSFHQETMANELGSKQP